MKLVADRACDIKQIKMLRFHVISTICTQLGPCRKQPNGYHKEKKSQPETITRVHVHTEYTRKHKTPHGM